MSALLVVHVIICVLLIIIVLLQASSGMDLGSAFGGGGSSDSFFGSKGTSSFFVKVTSVLAAIFMIISLFMSYNVTNKKKSVVEGMKIPVKSTQQQPVIPTLPNKK